MKKQHNQFRKLSADEMKALKGGVAMLPVYWFYCTDAAGLMCRFVNPEIDCGEPAGTCTNWGECTPAQSTGCL